MDKLPSYYSITPAPVRYDEKLLPMARLLYGEITALSNKLGYCWATNPHFARLYKVHRDTISEWISSLVNRGYLEIEIVGGVRRIRLRGLGENALHTTNTKSNNKKDFLKRKSSLKSMNEDEDIELTPVGEDGEEITHGSFGRPLKSGPKVVREGKNKIAIRIQQKFISLCKKDVGVTPVQDMKGYKMVLFALNTGGLTETQIYDLFDEWFGLGKNDDEVVQITRALSSNQINGYKARNQK
jgi:hypothetical protein